MKITWNQVWTIGRKEKSPRQSQQVAHMCQWSLLSGQPSYIYIFVIIVNIILATYLLTKAELMEAF
jgi:hypothetical protein